MKVSILRNDAFAMLSVATGYSENTLEEVIIKRMINEGLMAGDKNDCGWSIQQIAFQNKYDIDQFVKIIFPENIKNPEITELIDSIIIWGDGTCHPCPSCGCECDHEDDGGNDIWSCSNGECEFQDCNHPDVDILPGGYAFKNENI